MRGTASVALAALACAFVSGPAVADELLLGGSVATLAPLCGLRDEAWAFDLRRAEMQNATGSRRFDDEALRTAPGHREAEAALAFAETEALEDFAEGPPEQTCEPLKGSADLGRADDIVRAFRAQKAPQPGS